MVDGVNENFKPLKLKGAESKSIDLNKLDGLQKTDKNKSIFDGKFDLNRDGKIDENDVLDKNGNGVIDGEEVGILQKFLNKLGGRDHKASAKDFHMDNTANQTAFNGLDKLAQQQAAKMSGQDYIEKDGDTTTTIKPDGMTIIETKDGDVTKATITLPDGSRQESSTVDGKTTIIKYPPGSDEPSSKIVHDQEGNILSREDYRYENGEKITYKGTKDELIGITVEGKQTIPAGGALGLPEGEAEVTSEYKTEQDRVNKKPQSQTYTIDGKTYTVNYEYTEDGKVNATIHTDGEEDRTVQCKIGENGTIEAIKPEDAQEAAPATDNAATDYTVKKGDNLWNIAKAHLGDGVSAKDIANYVNKIMEANNLDWYDKAHTKVMIRPGDNLKLPATGTVEATEQITTPPQVTPAQGDLAAVKNPLTPEQTARFDKALADAKDYLINNKEELGLTDAEIEIIQKAGTESIKYGAARADKESHTILFNYNTPNREFDPGSFAKIMIHEATHMSINSKNNSVAEERQCETRALKCALKLLEKGLIEDQKLPPNGTKLSELKDEAKLTAYVEEWLTASEYRDRLPETAE